LNNTRRLSYTWPMLGKSKESSAAPPENQVEDQVKLPSLLGIRPGLYLAVLYGAVILGILFFIFLYPGLSKPGVLGVFSSEPSGAAVRIDGITLGAAPCEIFIPRGKHTIEMVLPGFTPFVYEAEMRGRIFASVFFPSRTPIRGTLNTPDPLGTLAAAASEYAHRSLAMEPTETRQIPQSLSEGVYRTAPATDSAEDREAARKAYFAVEDWAFWSVSLWSDPVLLGKYPDELLQKYGDAMPKIGADDMKIISTPLDFLGQNIYNGTPVKSDGKGGYEYIPPEKPATTLPPPNGPSPRKPCTGGRCS